VSSVDRSLGPVGGQFLRCSLCSELRHDEEVVWRASLDNVEIVAVASLGALATGHLLVCPLRHERSWLQLPDANVDQLLDVIGPLCEQLQRGVNAPVHLFEHGNAVIGSRVVCSVEHAHLHLLPAAVNVWSTLKKDRQWVPIHGGATEMKARANGREYLLYRPPGRELMMSLGDGESIRSQLLRRCFAEALGIPTQWNWRDHARVEDAARTARVVRGLLEGSVLAPCDAS
jgi:ATP adenylyltransferase